MKPISPVRDQAAYSIRPGRADGWGRPSEAGGALPLAPAAAVTVEMSSPLGREMRTHSPSTATLRSGAWGSKARPWAEGSRAKST